MAGISTLALLALSAANTVNGAVAQRRAGSAAEQQGNYEGDLLEQNAQLVDGQRRDVLARGRTEELASRRGQRQLRGAQRAALAGSGVEIDRGSAADVQAADAELGELDALTIRNNARRQAWGYEVQASDLHRQADLARSAGRNAGRSARTASVGTLLSGAGELASLYASAPKKISRYSGPLTASGARRGGAL